MVDYIRSELPEEVLLGQLAEECNELAKAALKTIRILDGRNPTPVTLAEAENNLIEEISDVMLCLTVLFGYELTEPKFENRMTDKLIRWVNRLKADREDKTED